MDQYERGESAGTEVENLFTADGDRQDHTPSGKNAPAASPESGRESAVSAAPRALDWNKRLAEVQVALDEWISNRDGPSPAPVQTEDNAGAAMSDDSKTSTEDGAPRTPPEPRKVPGPKPVRVVRRATPDFDVIPPPPMPERSRSMAETRILDEQIDYDPNPDLIDEAAPDFRERVTRELTEEEAQAPGVPVASPEDLDEDWEDVVEGEEEDDEEYEYVYVDDTNYDPKADLFARGSEQDVIGAASVETDSESAGVMPNAGPEATAEPETDDDEYEYLTDEEYEAYLAEVGDEEEDEEEDKAPEMPGVPPGVVPAGAVLDNAGPAHPDVMPNPDAPASPRQWDAVADHEMNKGTRVLWNLAVYGTLVAAPLIFFALSPFSPQMTVKHHVAAMGCQFAELVQLQNAEAGNPGYHPRLDPDANGVSCEPKTTRKTKAGSTRFIRVNP